MSRSSKSSLRLETGLVEVKSKFDAEFRRFSVRKQGPFKYEEFHRTLESLHHLQTTPFIVCYTDPTDGELLPINNDDNYQKALTTSKPLLRLLVQKKGEANEELNGYGTIVRKRNPLTKLVAGEPKPKPSIQISQPEDFRRVSAIIDVDIIPETHRRVKLMKNGSEKPLGFYIRDGTSVRVTPHGLEKVPGIFISRLVPGGLAESTGLLAVNDEVLEVNGIEVAGKSLDQVTDMMVANSSNLIITVKPVNQRNNLGPRQGSGRQSQKSNTSMQSSQSLDSDVVREVMEDDEDEDEIKDHIQGQNNSGDEQPTTISKDKNSPSPEPLPAAAASQSEAPPGATPANATDSTQDKDSNSATATL